VQTYSPKDLGLLKIACEESHLAFSQVFFKRLEAIKFILNWHHKLFADTVELVFQGLVTRLIINCPPGFTKTMMFVIFILARALAINPRARNIHLSHSETLALDNSAKIRQLIRDPLFRALWPIDLKADTTAKGLWYTQEGGHIKAGSTGGQVLGFRAGLMVDEFSGMITIDDPIKVKDSKSPGVNAQINSELVSTIKSRLMLPSTPVVIVMQRLGENDMSGFCLKGGTNEKWHHLVIPGDASDAVDAYPDEYTHGIPIRYSKREGLAWPMKYDQETLDNIKEADPLTYYSQYQQNPITPAGTIFKTEWWQYYKGYDSKEGYLIMLDDSRIKVTAKYMYGDTAQKKGQHNDFTCFECWLLLADGRIALIDLIREKLDAPELRERLPEFCAPHRYIQGTNNMGYREIRIEDKSSGTGLIQEMQRLPEIGTVVGIPRSADKVSRAHSAAPQIKLGRVLIPREASWLPEFKSEFARFNAEMTHAHDDMVDPAMDAIEDHLLTSRRINYAQAV
jgi:predicted phage terminase large subunit-like protein